jgi:primosomal protein N' (replication factor Y)
MCHYCGYSKEIDSSCPECNNEHLRFYGLGTQKLEEELQSLFGSVRVLRLDADTTLARDSFSKKLTQFANGEYDILIGTQMVAKGLDFPNVTLVGVIGADQAMYSEDYRSFERMFSLLTQVVGRAGRGDKKGKAVIQTVSPDSQLIKMAVKQDYEAFYNTEILTRKLMIYPPFCDMVMVASSSSDREEAFEAIKLVFDILKNGLETDYNDVKAVILGPSVASIPKISNRYRYRMLIKCRNNKRFRELLRKSLNIKLKKDTSVSVDINPETII